MYHSFSDLKISLPGVNDATQFLEPIFVDRDRELMVIAFCDDDVRLLRLLSLPGTAMEVGVSLGAIVRRAVKSGCAGLLLAHNHPSGDPKPSQADIKFTQRLKMSAEVVDLLIIDHLIFGIGPPFSFRRMRLL